MEINAGAWTKKNQIFFSYLETNQFTWLAEHIDASIHAEELYPSYF
jgi:hypothetical protein